ncbi:hypothetical protein [Brucella tritici]|uniref:Lysozyme inhibitor LprI N-terminal domain-containing protein n=1 Tax=Brucella tritici TaxID=94626 RepID=A0A6L3YDT9_9HYPH|nr:hypothetical protein [Brucella tritici]KAB2680042.1 hypothetical protein F9L08_21835 [Brucella tritici]
MRNTILSALASTAILASTFSVSAAPVDLLAGHEDYSRVVGGMLKVKVCDDKSAYQDLRVAAHSSARELDMSVGEIMYFAHQESEKIEHSKGGACQHANLYSSLCDLKRPSIAVSPIPTDFKSTLKAKIADEALKDIAIETIALRMESKNCGLKDDELEIADQVIVDLQARLRAIAFDDEFLSVGAWSLADRTEIFSKRFGSKSACDVVKELISNARNSEVGGD